jgi:hypothetical protein
MMEVDPYYVYAISRTEKHYIYVGISDHVSRRLNSTTTDTKNQQNHVGRLILHLNL